MKFGTAVKILVGMIWWIGMYIMAMRRMLAAKPMMIRRFLSERSFSRSSLSFSAASSVSSPATPMNW